MYMYQESRLVYYRLVSRFLEDLNTHVLYQLAKRSKRGVVVLYVTYKRCCMYCMQPRIHVVHEACRESCYRWSRTSHLQMCRASLLYTVRVLLHMYSTVASLVSYIYIKLREAQDALLYLTQLSKIREKVTVNALCTPEVSASKVITLRLLREYIKLQRSWRVLPCEVGEYYRAKLQRSSLAEPDRIPCGNGLDN